MGATGTQTSFVSRDDEKEYADKIREMIRHEDSVLAQRVSWCGTIEGLLTASLGFGWKNMGLTYLVCLAGLFIGISTLYASIITVKTMDELTNKWKNRSSLTYDGPPIIGRDVYRWNAVLRPSRAIPGVFVIFWPVVMIVRLIGN